MKIPVSDHSDIRTTLASLGAKHLGSIDQTDRYLDFPDRSLLASDSGLRVRRVTGEPDVLTFKGPRQEGTEAKIREELESACSPDGSIDAILDALGMIELVTVHKRREVFAFDTCEVLLDEVDDLGCFVEVEGPTLKAVQSVCAKLQLSGTPIRAGYAQLLSEKLNQ